MVAVDVMAQLVTDHEFRFASLEILEETRREHDEQATVFWSEAHRIVLRAGKDE